MREMRKSNAEWLGELPAEWEETTIGTLYDVRNDKVSDVDFPPLSVTMKGVVPQLETAAKTDAHDDRKLVREGDFCINSRSDRRGSCGIADRDGSVSLINTILSPRRKMNPKYYNWLFHTSLFADEFYRWGHGIVDDLWTTRWQEMKNISVPVPSNEQQEAIAEKLDEQVAKVDTLIANQEAQIEKLKAYKQSLITETVTKGLDKSAPMKDSGVEWIGEIPQGWTTLKLKYAAPTHDEKYESGEYAFIALENIESFSGKYVATGSKYELDGARMVNAGDVLFGKLRPYLAKVFEAKEQCCANGEFAVFAPKNISASYLKYFLLSNGFIEIVNASTYGTKMPRANVEFIEGLSIPIPSKDDQSRITRYLDGLCVRYDRLIEIKQQKIEKLNAYKKSLIYEYVTGKKEVE